MGQLKIDCLSFRFNVKTAEAKRLVMETATGVVFDVYECDTVRRNIALSHMHADKSAALISQV